MSTPAFLLGVAVALPLLLAPGVVPDSVFYNQLAAVGLWGLALIGGRPKGWSPAVQGATWQTRRLGPVVLATAAVFAGLALISAVARQFTSSGVLLLAAVVVLHGAGAARSDSAIELFTGFAVGLVVAGALSVAVASIQFFGPSLADGVLVAPSALSGRAVGNLRQPNHLATTLLMACVALGWLWQVSRANGRVWLVGWMALFALVAALVMSASRTGLLSLAVLAAWAVIDRRLPRELRCALAATPLMYALCWLGLDAWAQWQQARFYGADRLHADGDISSSRFAIWRNALTLITMHPWQGVGWGNFNFAWTFTPFPDRPVAFFDHTHNLVLQLAVEIGVPAAVSALGLFGWGVWRARGAWRRGGEAPHHPARAALVMLVVLAVHSMLEYPLWYAYFLLPAAWVLGYFIGSAPGDGRVTPARRWLDLARQAVGALMLIGTIYVAWDHRRIESIFAPGPGAAPLAERIAEGRRSALFGHHADYAAVTTLPRVTAPEYFRRPLRQLIDARLLIAYSEALKAEGRVAEALYAAQRLREFRRPDAQAWFQDCGGLAPPWQCDTRPVALTWRDLLP